jgi:magnesium transporter
MKALDLKEIFEKGKDENIQAYLNFLDPLELVDLFYMIDDEHFRNIVVKLDSETLAQILPFFEKGLFEKIIELIANPQLIHIFDHLVTDDASYLLRMLDCERREEVLPHLNKKEQIERILSYSKDSAGSIMQTEVCRLKEHMNIKEAIESIRVQKRILGEVRNSYVVDQEKRLVGTVQIDDLILGRMGDDISHIMRPLKYYVLPHEDQEEVSHIFSKYDLAYLPVVDKEGILLGHITYDDIQDVVEEEASEDLLAYVGVSPEESISDLDTNKVRLALGRFPWLIFSICSSFITGYILTHFDTNVANAILFASFVPLIMNTTGNVGTQSAMIMTRSFALGANEFGHFRLPLMREFIVGLTLGLMTGVVTFVLIFVLYQDVLMAIRVGSTLIISMTTAALFGMSIPVGFKKIGIDPAIASGPLVTSGCDLLSVSLYFLVIIGLKGIF